MAQVKPSGGSVFLVEDEVMIRMMVADMLEELGYSIAAEAGEIEQALEFAQTMDFDIAILDVNLNGKLISPVADVIEARNRPSSSQPAMARRACRSNIATAPCCRSRSRWKTSPT
jgi:CheY-like chemotaxis protein